MFTIHKNWQRKAHYRVRSHWRSAGFTLVELLVVIAIIGMLVGLLLPAINGAIESARRAACANNMKQIVLAAHTYETQLHQYPLNWGQVSSPGYPTTSNPGTSAVGLSWMTGILPNLDNGPLYNQVMFGPTINIGYSNGTYNNLAVSQTDVPTFHCPSDRGFAASPGLPMITGAAVTNYKAVAGSNWMGCNVAGLSSLSITGTRGRNANSNDGIDHGNGVICRGGANAQGGAPYLTGNMDLRDGASKTFFLGESLPEYCPYSAWFWFDGSTATCGVPLNWYHTPGVPQATFQAASSWSANYGFMSRHRSGANFAMCDGSVTYINELMTSDTTTVVNPTGMQIYQGLATIDGNEAVSAPQSWPP
jgi:prepilin-type N-terminal cleavage/methylation domain-containing protein/prepilin-type processing-associated H-X9-DG protein